VWAFAHIGFRIFALPKADSSPVDARHVHLLWDWVPTIYAPGVVLFVVAFSVWGQRGLALGPARDRTDRDTSTPSGWSRGTLSRAMTTWRVSMLDGKWRQFRNMRSRICVT
jgi:hypothetical protein